MSRSDRLFDLIQVLRAHRRPVTGAQLADELRVSLRTIYRDMQTLIAKGAPIDGEAGIGYLLRPGFTLPPLMFSIDEIDAHRTWIRHGGATADRTLTNAAPQRAGEDHGRFAGRPERRGRSVKVFSQASSEAARDRVDLTGNSECHPNRAKDLDSFSATMKPACGQSEGYGRSHSLSARKCVCSPHGANFARATGTSELTGSPRLPRSGRDTSEATPGSGRKEWRRNRGPVRNPPGIPY